MVVRKLKVFPVEAIVRGYLAGSAWVEYQTKGTVHGIKVPEGMKESQAFEKPLFTPSTKAEKGDHGEFPSLNTWNLSNWVVSDRTASQMRISTLTKVTLLLAC